MRTVIAKDNFHHSGCGMFGKYIAHRGLYTKGVPENSMDAFKRAVEKGFDIELDVRLTKDCKVIVFHDDDLMRMFGVEGKVCDFTYQQLQAFELPESHQKIPLFKDVLKMVDGKVALLIEIKQSSPFGELEKRVDRLLRKYTGNYAVESFNPFSMGWFRIFSKNVKRGQLISEYKYGKSFDRKYILRKICAKPIVWRLISKPDFVAGDLRSVKLSQIFAAIDMDADYFSWTADSDELIKNAQMFSRSIIFENYDNIELL